MILRIFASYACWFLVVTTLFAGMPADPGPVPSLQLSFTHVMGQQPLVRKQVTYTNASGEAFTVSRFRYFLSNFSLEAANGSVVTLPPAYFLVDDAIDSSKNIRLDSIPAGEYRSIRFLIGVDSIRNVSGVQAGALAVESGMFWTWNSGYIMAQIEGHSTAVNTPMQEFLFHCGGYKSKDGVLKYVTLPLPQPLTVSADKQPRINVTADVEKWFLPDTVSFKKITVIMAPGVKARQVAGNYQHMFNITGISN
ncbi:MULTISPECIES: MbnP family protein [unclassified Chitinophaga]|uniref:MbnP family protein n=1 Tax=unclassified Chitinophaga TaxID=2619133 RepID=UPI00300FC8CB